MKIKFLVSMAGAVDRHVGDVADLPSPAATRLIDAGFAELTTEPVGNVFAAPVETAAAVMSGIEYRGRKLFGAAANAVRAKLAKAKG